MKRFLKILFVLAVILQSPAVPGEEKISFAGKTLEEALRHFQFQGLNILFSSDLVRPEMKVSKEPTGNSHKVILGQLLSPHGLRIKTGPANTLLVVRHSLASDESGDSQTPSPAGSETVVVPFVTVYFTARDSQNRIVTDLSAKHVMVQEDGELQSLVEFTNFARSGERQPLTVFFLLDSSHSMQALQDGNSKYDLSKQAIFRVLDELEPQDQMMVTGFHENSWIISEMTTDPEMVRHKLLAQKAVPGKRTAVFDALKNTVKQVQHYSGRRIIILCSDGEDNFSKSSLKDLIASLKSTDVTVVSFGPETRKDTERKGTEILKNISEVTGGFAFFSSRLSDLDSVVEDFRNVMENQYAAGYIPPKPMLHKKREVRILCLVPGIQLHYRKSYLF